MDMRDKIRGCFLGIGIGDALGKPAEMMTPERIAARWGRLTTYVENTEHKYYDGRPVGSTTDDLQLTMAVARGMIRGKGFDLDLIAEEHVNEFKITTDGWGTSTRESIKAISEGVHWSKVTKDQHLNDKLGWGNGVCMKIAPVGLYFALIKNANELQKVSDLTKFTHATHLAFESGMAHVFATISAFKATPENFSVDDFIDKVLFAVSPSDLTKPNLYEQFVKLKNHKDYTTEGIVKELKGSCYVYESLPFTYMFFCKNHYTIEALYDCVNAGGDADSNASMIGGLLGALHGTKIFPQHLIDGLQNYQKIIELADNFYDTFSNR